MLYLRSKDINLRDGPFFAFEIDFMVSPITGNLSLSIDMMGFIYSQ